MSSNPRDLPQGNPKLRRRLLVSLLLLPATFLAVELGYRGWLRLNGTPYSTWRTERDLARLVSSMQDRVPQGDPGDAATTPVQKIRTALHPYLGFWPERDFDRMVELAAYYKTPEAQRNYDVVILGGSVAALYGGYAPTLLAPLLERGASLHGRPVRIHGFGCAAFKEPQQLDLLGLLLSMGHEPDAVIVLDGYNEIAVASENARSGVHPLFPSWFQMMSLLKGGITDPRGLDTWLEMETGRREARRLYGTARRWRLTYSAVLGRILERRLVRLGRQSMDALVRYREELLKQGLPLSVEGPAYVGGPDQLLEDCIRAWKEGARGLQALCRAHGIHYLHVLQPSRDDEGSKPLTAREIAAVTNPQWIEDIRKGYPRLREAAAELPGLGVNFLDATRVFEKVETDVYIDGCHFGLEGYEPLSRFIAPVFLSTMPAGRQAGDR